MAQTQQVRGVQTAVYSDGKNIEVFYHKTCVVTIRPDSVTLRTGGWRTVTTKLRMNQAANQYGLGFTVSQKDGDWTVNCRDGRKLKFDDVELTFKR